MNTIKRAACDRCHNLKMRCIREPTRQKCNRCLNSSSGAACIYSVARRAGRPPSTRASRGPVHHVRARYSPNNEATRHDSIMDLSGTPESFNAPSLDTDISGADSISLPSLEPLSESMGDAMDSYGDASLFGESWTDTTMLWADSLIPSECPEKQHQLEMQRDEDTLSSVSAMERLSDLSGRLFAQIRSHKTLQESEKHEVSVESLAANVIQGSVTFTGILRDTTTSETATDTATILQILTAYLRLTELHLTLYEHVRSLIPSNTGTSAAYLADSQLPSPRSTSVAPIPSIFPDLSIGGISLSNYPNFQLKFLLQICVHHLGELEEILGLPPSFCISDDCNGTGVGILQQGSKGTTLLIRTIMTEAHDTVKAIRRVLAELREELRGSIQI